MMATAAKQATIATFTLRGVTPVPVEVQVDVSPGVPSFVVVGLADTAVLEARDRVRSALRASGFALPSARLTVNLAPAPLRKHGTGFDLPIAVAILVATGQVLPEVAAGRSYVGELSLDGGVRPVPGLLAHASGAASMELVVAGPPEVCVAAGAVGARCVSVQHLASLEAQPVAYPRPPEAASCDGVGPDFADVAGHESVKRALEVAAVGSHNVLMVGPPGSGKSMLARRLPSILPPLDLDERRASALVHSVAGLDATPIFAGARPFRAPHHSATIAGLCGGGVPPTPGEISLAHNGVLFLDEIAQVGPATLQTLRQPLEDGWVRLVRADGTYTFPARFTLVAAANPCPCGYYGDRKITCRCSRHEVDAYQGRLGGPLLDRMDIRLRVDPERADRILEQRTVRDSRQMRDRVERARMFAAATHPDTSALSGPALAAGARMTRASLEAVLALEDRSGMSGRGVARLIRVARSVADLELSEDVTCDHVDEAYALRGSEGPVMPM
jgi:magnesium chelatase family protein